MSNISKRIASRYDTFTDYFKDTSFGRNPHDLTVLSLLPPVDRCVIIERIMEFGRCDFLVCIDKLSMAYVKAGMERLAFEFIARCDEMGWLSGDFDCQYFMEKLERLTVHSVSCSYTDALRKLPQYDDGSLFCRLLETFCCNYAGAELINGSESDDDLVEFVNERRAFFLRFMRDRRKESVIPSETSGAGRGFTLANTQAIAFCYLLGGSRVTNFMFATSETLAQSDAGVRRLWEESEPLFRASAPYPYSYRRDGGERAYFVSLEFPCYGDEHYQYRTSQQRITVQDVVCLMREVMDITPLTKAVLYPNGEKSFRFTWMYLEEDIDRLLDIFSSVRYRYGAWVQQQAVFSDMDHILNMIARRAARDYPFMQCEFTGW